MPILPQVREAAAHALPAVISGSTLGFYLPQALARARSSATQNELHGRLLQLLILVRDVARPFDPSGVHQPFVASLVDAAPSLLLQNRCGPTQALFVQVVGAVRNASGPSRDPSTFVEVDRFCQRQIEERKPASGIAASVGDDLLKLACARYILGDALKMEEKVERFSSLIQSTDEVAEIALLHLEGRNETVPSLFASLSSPIAFDKKASQRCRQPALRLIASSESKPFRRADAEVGWEGLMEEFELSTCQPFKEALLPVLGTLAKVSPPCFLLLLYSARDSCLGDAKLTSVRRVIQRSDPETTTARLARLLQIVDASSHEAQVRSFLLSTPPLISC